MKGTRYVSASVRRIVIAGCCAMAALSVGPTSEAFFPIGGFDQFGQLRYMTWPFHEFDTNNDGEIMPGEGLDIRIEGGKSGYTTEEIQIVEDAFQVWQDVPTTYASFRFVGVIEDPILVANTTSPDFLTVVALQVTESTSEDVVADPSDVIVSELAPPVLGVTLPLYTIEDEVLTVAGETYFISAGTMIDVDIVIDATSVRPSVTGAEPLVDLKSVLVHEIGHLLGLGHTPLNNLRAVPTQPGSTSIADLLENEVFWLTGAAGVGRFIGASPTMFPIYFITESGTGTRHGGTADLAPDDISGVSFLYPRGSQENFFSINQEARTHTRPGTGLPSVPLPGGHVVAWADVDNDPNTPRVPLFSTMAGLYERLTNKQLEGRFELLGLWKQTEVPGGSGALFNPTYAITLNPLNATGLDRQAPSDLEVGDYDSIQGKYGLGATQRDDYVTAFPSEVFHEVENISDVSSKDAGTPLVWSFEQNTVISGDTQRTLPDILPNNRPMFGDPNDVCPLNVIETPGTGGGPTTTTGAGLIRKFRDRVLLESALGTAVVEMYYQVSPVVARFLLKHGAALRLFRSGVHGMYWILNHKGVVLAWASAGVVALWLLWKRRSSLGRTVRLGGLLLVAALAWAWPASAQIAYRTTPEMAAGADEIVVGKVASAESRWARGGRIYTDVVFEVADTAKGNLNKSSNISFSVIGGRVGGFIYKPSEMPAFEKGQQVLLYLRRLPDNRLVVYGGVRGRLNIVTDTSAAGGKVYVAGGGPETDRALAEDAKAMSKDGGDGAGNPPQADQADGSPGIPLDRYLEYLRGIVREQERNQK